MKFWKKSKIRIQLKFKKKIASHISSASLFDDIGNATDGDVATMTIEGLIDLLKEKKSFILSQDVARYVRFVGFDNGVLSINLEDGHPREIIKNLNHFFEENKYKVKVVQSSERGEDTLEQKKKALFNKQLEEISQNPILKEILQCFSNSIVANIEEL